MKRTRFLCLLAQAILILLVGLFGLVGVYPEQAHAASITVTNCNDSGPGSLRDTLASAASGSIITFSLSCDIKLNSTLTISTNNLTLDGQGQQVTLDGQHAVQDLIVSSNITFTLNALTIANGSAGEGSNGGGLENNGTVTITNSTFAHNSASANIGGGGLSNNFGVVTISNCTFANNSARDGGGLSTIGGRMTITNSTFTNNSTLEGDGGGLANFGTTLSIGNSTIVNNMTEPVFGLFGGGLSISGGSLSISNSTIAHNSASGQGGGLFSLADVPVSISNSTIVNNSAPDGGSGLYNFRSPVSIGGSIVANNTGSNCGGRTLTDQGYNLESGTDCGFTGTGDLQNTDPKLDPNGLQNNGGPTQTIALEPDSPTVDHIPVGSSCPDTDQRGVKRPQGPACDTGAFEMTAADGLTVMIHVVDSFNLSRGLQMSLDAKLQAALTSVEAGNTTACGQLDAFSNAVKAHVGEKLTSNQAQQLQAEATQIQTLLAC